MKRLKIAGIIVVLGLVGAVAFGAVALADEPANADRPLGDLVTRVRESFAAKLGYTPQELDEIWMSTMEETVAELVEEDALPQEMADRLLAHEWRFGQFPQRSRRGPGNDFMQRALRNMVQIAAETLDMTVEDLMAALREGRSIADVAEARGVELQTIVDAILADAEAALAKAVEADRLTQEQAEQILARLEQELPERLTRPLTRLLPQPPPRLRVMRRMLNIVAQALDMDVQALRAELCEGKSVADVAEEQGVDLHTIVEVILATTEEELAQAVEAGRITQEQADEILGRLAKELPARLEQQRAPCDGGRGGRRGPSRGGPGQGGPNWRPGLIPENVEEVSVTL